MDHSLFKLSMSKLNCKFNTSHIIPAAFNRNECPSNLFHNPSFLSIFDSFLNGFSINQEIGCYGSKIILKCPQNHFIYILAGYYGIQSGTVVFIS